MVKSVGISIDEVHLKISRYCNYVLVIQDFITGDPIDLVADRKKLTTEPYFHGIPLKERAKVKYLITDMYRPFEKYVSSYFPNAIHIVDSFHARHSAHHPTYFGLHKAQAAGH